MPLRRALLLTALALTGLLVAVGVTVAVSSLTSQTVGLTAEPLTAGRELAPQGTSAQPARTTTSTPTTGSPSTPAPVPGTDDEGEADDDSGKGRGRGRGRDDDDDEDEDEDDD